MTHKTHSTALTFVDAVMLRILKGYILILSIINIDYSMVSGHLSPRKRNNSKMTGKIIGGVPVPIEQYSFLVQLFNNGRVCAGSIVNSWTILTAAHCFDINLDPDEIEVQAGSRYIRDFESDTYFVDSIVIHDKYNETRDFSFDIALLFVEKPFKFKENVKKVILAHNNEWMDQKETEFAVAGWGWNQYPSGKLSKTGLMMTYLKFIPQDVCSRMHGLPMFNESLFCLYGDGLRDACKGDSGGGVLWKGMIVGIISHGYGCATKNKPSFYTNVFYFRNWIKHQVIEFIKKYCESQHSLRLSTHIYP